MGSALSPRYASQSAASVAVSKSMLFNTDPHTMKETIPSSGYSSSGSSAPVPTSDSKSWGLPNYIQPSISNPYGALPGEVTSPTYSSSSLPIPEPPPAHSGTRPSTIQRNPYQTKVYTEPPKVYSEPSKAYPEPTKGYTEPSPPTRSSAHVSRVAPPSQGGSYHLESVLRGTNPLSSQGPPAAHSNSHSLSRSLPSPQTYADPPRSMSTHQTYQQSPPSMTAHHRFAEPPRSIATSHGTYSSSSRLPLPVDSHHLPSPYETYNNTSTSSAYSTIAPPPTSSQLHSSLSYDPVSPAPTMPDSQSTESRRSYPNVLLEDLAHISSKANFAHSIKNPSPLHSSPQRMSRGLADLQYSSAQQSLTNTVQSPMQPSPISVGSPQVGGGGGGGMSLGSPQGSHHAPSSTVPVPPLPVQAMADSTTKPKKRRRSKKDFIETPKKEMTPPLTPLTPLAYQQPSTPNSVPHTPTSVSVPSNHSSIPTPESGIMQSYEAPLSNASYIKHEDLSPMTAADPRFLHDNMSPAEEHSMSHPHPHHPHPPPHPHHPHPHASQVYMEQVPGEHVFMTNSFGSAFANPPPENYLQSPLEQQGGDDSSSYDMNSLSPGMQNMPPKKRKNKVEQREIVADPEEEDDEFAHLKIDPELLVKAEEAMKKREPPMPKVVEPAFVEQEFERPSPPPFHIPDTRDPPHTAPVPASMLPPVPKTGFQGSFMSFLQGKKPETLSSVTNSSVKRPPMPKYVPEPRRPAPQNNHSEDGLSSSGNAFSSDRAIDVPAITFTDDEDQDSSHSISKTVLSVISHLGDDTKDSGAAPLMSVRSLKGKTEKKRKRKKKKELVIPPFGGLPSLGGGWSSDEDGAMAAKRAAAAEPGYEDEPLEEALPARTTSSRKAKEKLQQKRKEKAKRKSKSSFILKKSYSHLHTNVAVPFE